MAQSIGKFISGHQAKAKRQQAEAAVKLLLNLTQAVTAAPDFNAALYSALSTLCQTTGWIYGEVWLPAANGIELEVSPVWYCSEAVPASTVAALRQLNRIRGRAFEPNQSLVGRVWSQQPEWTSDDPDWLDQHSDQDLQHRFRLVGTGIKARLSVPIVTERGLSQQALAVLVFFTLEAQPQDPQLIQLVSGVAMQLGTVLAQKQAEDALRQSAEREQALLRVIERMRQTLDIEQIFRTTAAELHQLLKCDRVLIYRFNPDWSGEFVAEAVSSLWEPVLAESIENAVEHDPYSRCVVKAWGEVADTYLQDTQGGIYSRGGKYLCVPNVQQADLSDCYLALAESASGQSLPNGAHFSGSATLGAAGILSKQRPAPLAAQRDPSRHPCQHAVRRGAPAGRSAGPDAATVG